MTTVEAQNVVRPVVLEGANVRLEPLAMEHAQALLAAAADRTHYQWTVVPRHIESMEAYIGAALELAERGEAVPFATVRRSDGRVVGSTRFANFEWQPWPKGNPHHRPGCPDGVEIGWTWLAEEAQRTPINTEAKLLMLGHAFETWRVKVVRLKTDARNERSRNAILRLGCAFDGVLRAHSPGADGQMRDSAYYSMLESGWPAAKAALQARLDR